MENFNVSKDWVYTINSIDDLPLNILKIIYSKLSEEVVHMKNSINDNLKQYCDKAGLRFEEFTDESDPFCYMKTLMDKIEKRIEFLSKDEQKGD